jgi:hypothetical protein
MVYNVLVRPKYRNIPQKGNYFVEKNYPIESSKPEDKKTMGSMKNLFQILSLKY